MIVREEVMNPEQSGCVPARGIDSLQKCTGGRIDDEQNGMAVGAVVAVAEDNHPGRIGRIVGLRHGNPAERVTQIVNLRTGCAQRRLFPHDVVVQQNFSPGNRRRRQA